jgi:hypothetical protein
MRSRIGRKGWMRGSKGSCYGIYHGRRAIHRVFEPAELCVQNFRSLAPTTCEMGAQRTQNNCELPARAVSILVYYALGMI